MNAAVKKATHPEAATVIRAATPADVPLIIAMIRELAEFEKLAHEMVADEETLRRTMFGPRPYAEALIAEIDGEPAGFALFFHNFSTFLGKPGLYLEDLFVRPEYRGHGLGQQFFRRLAQIALERDCGRMEWWVLDWNEAAIRFYQRLGAKPMDEWTVQRLTRPEIERLATGD